MKKRKYKNATITEGSLIQWKEEKDKWGIVTCFSDDMSTVCYKPRGLNGVRCSATLDKIELG